MDATSKRGLFVGTCFYLIKDTFFITVGSTQLNHNLHFNVFWKDCDQEAVWKFMKYLIIESEYKIVNILFVYHT